MPAQIGKRYVCPTCSGELLVTKPGTGSLSCHGAEMEPAQAKQLPSSD